MRRSYLLLLALVIYFSTGCLTITSQKNRPGEGEVRDPPPQMDVPERVVPEDPGGWYAVFGFAPVLEMGATFGADERRRTVQLGGELFAGGGTTDETGVLLGARFARIRFLTAPMLVVGWLPYSSQASIDGRVYAEVGTTLQTRDILARLSVGASWETARERFGVQSTLKFYEVLYLRGNRSFDGSWSMMFGVTFPFASVYLRSY